MAMASTVLIQFRSIYTYFGKIPLRIERAQPSPMTVLTIDRLRRRRVPEIVAGAMTRKSLASISGIEVFRNLTSLELAADPPVAVQADGEALGLAERADVEWVPNALRVIRGP